MAAGAFDSPNATGDCRFNGPVHARRTDYSQIRLYVSESEGSIRLGAGAVTDVILDCLPNSMR